MHQACIINCVFWFLKVNLLCYLYLEKSSSHKPSFVNINPQIDAEKVFADYIIVTGSAIGILKSNI